MPPAESLPELLDSVVVLVMDSPRLLGLPGELEFPHLMSEVWQGSWCVCVGGGLHSDHGPVPVTPRPE